MNEAQGHCFLSRDWEAMDAGLAEMGLRRLTVARDASCVYRIVAQQIFYTQVEHQEVRRQCARSIQGNSHLLEKIVKYSLKHLAERVLDIAIPAGSAEMAALALLYRCDFLIYKEPRKPPVKATDNGFSKKVMLCQRYEAKYDAVCSKREYAAAAFCQSVVYDLLYTRVLGVSPAVVAREVEWFRLQEKNPRGQKESDGKQLVGFANAERTSIKRSSTYQVHLPAFRYRVLKSLDPEIYRHVEFEIWHESTKWYNNARRPSLTEFAVDSKCEVQLEQGGRYENAFVQKIHPYYKTMTVFIKSIKQSRLVALDSVRAVGHQSACDRKMGFQGAPHRQHFEIPSQQQQWKTESYCEPLSHTNRPDYHLPSGHHTGSGFLYKAPLNIQHIKPPRKIKKPPALGSEKRCGGVIHTPASIQAELSSNSGVQEPNYGLTDSYGENDSPGTDYCEQPADGSKTLTLDSHCVDKSEAGTEDTDMTPLPIGEADGEHAFVKRFGQSFPANASMMSSSVQQPIPLIYSQAVNAMANLSFLHILQGSQTEWVNSAGEVIASPPPFSCDPNASDLPQDRKILQHFFNRGLQSWWNERAYAQNWLAWRSGVQASLHHLSTAACQNPPTLQLQTQPLEVQTTVSLQPTFVMPHQLPYSHVAPMALPAPWQGTY